MEQYLSSSGMEFFLVVVKKFCKAKVSNFHLLCILDYKTTTLA